MPSQEQPPAAVTDEAPVPDKHADRRLSIALTVIVTCQLMVSVDSNVVNIALPKIQAGLSFSPTALAWVFSAYSLAYGGLLLLGGRASDILGRKRMFTWGLGLVVAASVLGGCAPTEGLLIAARALQGVGFAFSGPAALSLLAATFPEGPKRTRALGAFSMVTGLGITLGLVLGGVLTMASWRLVFFINVPIGVATILLARPYLTETERHPGRFDLAGALTSTLGMASIVYGFTHASTAGWTDTTTLLSFVVGVVLLGVFVLVEKRAASPIMPLHLLAQRTRAGAYSSFVFLMAAMAGVYILLSLFVQDALGFSPLVAGLAFLPMAVVQFFAARSAPKLIPRFGMKPVLIAGVTLMLAEALWLTTTGTGSTYFTGLLGPFILLGAGLSLAFVPLNMTVLGGLARQDTGAASGLLQAAQQVGLSLGVAILSTIYQTQLGDGHSHGEALGKAVIAAAGFSACALLIAIFVIRTTKTARSKA
ncbi:MFS transporter [Amycolatopsis sp.]|uniref:MFS transporter n=1 Tax=Amycolatopsis sp. TaxID=37632 RepID=UPI002BBAD3E1|nr:MFS transporter [Amycolatopsis sp.]HVV11361.1 MFS transporter [Amycolatopsis sp.]